MNKLEEFLSKNKAPIKLGIGTTGLVAAAVFAGKAAVKAYKLIEEKKKNGEELSKKDIFKLTWKCFITPSVLTISSITTIVCAGKDYSTANAAVTAACAISEATFKKYTDKAIDILGEEKEKEIRDSIAEDELKKNPYSNTQNKIVIMGDNDMLCFDSMTGRYFKSCKNEIEAIVNELNKQLLEEDCVSLNEFYDRLGLDPVDIGNNLEWESSYELIELNYSSRLTDTGEPCMVITFRHQPRYTR